MRRPIDEDGKAGWLDDSGEAGGVGGGGGGGKGRKKRKNSLMQVRILFIKHTVLLKKML